MNRGKLLSGVAAVSIYFLLIFLVLYHYNVHKQKAKNYVEKNSNRVTVTLVNSDKTVLNRSDKVNTPTKPVEMPKPTPTPVRRPVEVKQPQPPKEQPKVSQPKRQEQKNRESAEREKKRLAQEARENRQKEQERKRIAAQEAKRIAETKRIARVEVDKKRREEARQRSEEAKKKKEAAEAKRREAERKKERERQRLAEAKKRKEAEERRRQEEAKKRPQAQDLFANVNGKEPVKRTPQPVQEPNRVKHTSTATDRIRSTQQSGQVSDRNRERGVENAYIAKVKRQLNNWSAQSNYKGHRATIRLTISGSGHFRYSVQSSSSGEMSVGLRQFLDQLNRMGLGPHNKSTPYVISVNFIAN